MIANVHHIAALLAGATALVLLLVVGFGALRHRPTRFAADRAILLALAVVALGILSGLLVFLGGGAPADPLHFVYAVVALAILPAIRFWDRLARHRSAALGIGALLLAGLALRLFQTG